jgi:hypothetical protein
MRDPKGLKFANPGKRPRLDNRHARPGYLKKDQDSSFPQPRGAPSGFKSLLFIFHLLVFPMSEEKTCKSCGAKESRKWIERQNIAGMKAYFCRPECYQEYKKKGAESGVCEFC